MLTEVEEVVKVYREYSLYPTVTNARVSNSETAGHVRVYSEWKMRDLERQQLVKFSRNHIAQLDVIFPTPPTDISTESLNRESPSGKYRAILRKVKDKKDEEKQFIEIWNDACKIKNIPVEDIMQHGKIYEDAQFGCFEWSYSETHLLYVAEKKCPKSKSFFDKKPVDTYSKEKEDLVPGDEFIYTEDWGEQLVEKVHPVICILDIENVVASTLDNLPEDVSAGQARWCKDDTGVICVGWWHTPYRLGLIYCPMRRSAIFYIDLKTSECTILGSKDRSVRSPQFNPDFSRLVWLDNAEGGPHMQCSRLIMCDWSTKGIVPVVDIVRKAPAEQFQGLFCTSLSQRCWATDNRRLLVTTNWRSALVTVVIDTETGSVTKLGSDSLVGSLVLKDIHKDLVVASCSSPNEPNYLVIGQLPAAGKEDCIKWTPLHEGPPAFLEFTWRTFSVEPPLEQVNSKYGPMDYECILLEPTQQDVTRKPPLVVYPHGGPHTAFATDFMFYFACLCKCGFTVLAVNYRGSVGYGQDSIDSLLGNIGSQDVKDVQNAANVVVEMDIVDKDKVVVIGGSHGGFLTAHLIGQYPDFYKAACCRNPVINLCTMYGTSDIPDWCSTEVGSTFDHKEAGHLALYDEFWKRSPIRYVDQIKTPVMIMIGAVDNRVPPKQGQELRKALQARGVPVRTLLYPGNAHPIDKVDSEADAFVNIVQWFVQHLQ